MSDSEPSINWGKKASREKDDKHKEKGKGDKKDKKDKDEKKDHKDKDDKKDKKDKGDKKDKKDKKDKDDKKDKKDKDEKKDKKDKPSDGHTTGAVAHSQVHSLPQQPPPFPQAQYAPAPPGGSPFPDYGHQPPVFPQNFVSQSQTHLGSYPPPPHISGPSGFRLPLTSTASFPMPQEAGVPPCVDADGVSPVFIGSALFERSVHPCKIGPHLVPPASVPYNGVECAHHGRYDLLVFVPEQMEFVRTSHGQLPPGRKPIEGGYEESGSPLYHAIGVVNGLRVPGKTGEHLRACHVAFGGQEHVLQDYELLCWR